MQDEAVIAAPTAAQCLRIARGLSSIFWGIGVSVLLMMGFLTIGLFSFVRLSPHIIGAVIVLAGAIRLHRARPPIEGWPNRTKMLIAAACLQIYLVPFLAWWRQLPGEKFYAANVFMLVLATLWLLSLVNKLVADVATALGNRVLNIEARFCELSATFFILGPLFGVLFYTLLNSLRTGSAGRIVHVPPIYVWPLWVHVFIAIPFLLTMAAAWECKQECMARIEEDDEM